MHPTESDNGHSSGPADLSTDFASLMADSNRRPVDRPKPKEATDFRSLSAGRSNVPPRYQQRTTTDLLIDALTPLMIFVMVWSVIWFLLDIRDVFVSGGDRIQASIQTGLRWVAFCFVMGIVALNRLIARDGKEESFLYIIGLALAIGLYTLVITSQVGSLARGFLNHPVLATAFNMALVVLVWWAANRLTHECCVDENPTAGDVGILTGTRQRIGKAMKSGGLKNVFKRPEEEPIFPVHEIGAFDPNEKRRKKENVPRPPVAQRLPKRHPGISIFYTSVPVMIIFIIGQRFLQGRSPEMILATHFYVGAYTVSALLLLMLSSLGGLRGYFRARRVRIPNKLGPFWIGLGIFMTGVVLIGATALPMPRLPRAIRVEAQAPGGAPGGDKGEADRDSSRKAKQQKFNDKAEASQESGRKQQDDGQQDPNGSEQRQQSQNQQREASRRSASKQQMKTPNLQMPSPEGALKILQYVVLGIMGLVGLVVALRILALLGGALGKNAKHANSWLARLGNALSRLIFGLTRLPAPRMPKRTPRVDRAVSLSAGYANPLGNPRMTPAEMIEYSYDALCALAEDAAVPRDEDQTPYEFIQSFPEVLGPLRDEADELTTLYVFSAYSRRRLDEATEDTLRRFWQTYERVRARVVR